MIVTETERLILRHFHIFDAEAMYRVFGDAEVMRFGPGVQTARWVRDWLRGCLEDYYKEWGFGPWAVMEKRTREIVGYCGLFYFPDIVGQPEVEIGFRLARSVWGLDTRQRRCSLSVITVSTFWVCRDSLQ
jgi:RimJ/RimL family protein N-acetyltransferase